MVTWQMNSKGGGHNLSPPCVQKGVKSLLEQKLTLRGYMTLQDKNWESKKPRKNKRLRRQVCGY